MPEPSPQLLARCRLGDNEAFGQLLAQQQNYVYNLAYRLTGNPDEAGDLAQEALLRAWQMLPSYRGESRFTTWLYRLVVNLGLNLLVRLRRQSRGMPLGEEAMPEAADEAADPQRLHDAREMQENLWRQVDALPDKYRLVIALYYQQERSYQEIAEITQLPINTVKTHLARARQMLAANLTGGKGGQG
jgi:RNA polymerase sigma-70 factor, ECF subfamily